MYLRFKNLLLTHAQFAHSLRVTMAIAFSLIFYHFIPVPHSMWGPITVAVVLMQPHAGVIKQKGFQRVGGTLLGAILGLVTVFFSTKPRCIYSYMDTNVVFFTVTKITW